MDALARRVQNKYGLLTREEVIRFIKMSDEQVPVEMIIQMWRTVIILELAYRGLPIDIIEVINDDGVRSRVEVYMSSKELCAVDYFSDEKIASLVIGNDRDSEFEEVHV